LGDFSVFVCADYEKLPQIFHHPPFTQEGYICATKEIQKCVASQRFGFGSGKCAAIGSYNTKWHSSIGQEIFVLSTDRLKNCHIISGWLSYSLLYINCNLCLVAVWWF
jgi:hypothetical protein